MHAQSRIAAKIAYITLGAMLGALLLVSQLVLAGLPNIELVSLLIIVWTRVYRTGALPGIAVFVVLEGVIFGFGIWWVSYLYIWFILWGIVMLIPRRRSEEPLRGKKLLIASLGWAILSGAYGFAFGALTAIPWFFRGGLSTMVAYWVSGIPFDIPHALGNFAAALLLAVPLIELLGKLKKSRNLS
ncbi:MAG: hypothetical protein E7662_09080 [Ruminococcaceae bacterium]|nr:hypothetical protein [Oscillospiraceae bacterium]